MANKYTGIDYWKITVENGLLLLRRLYIYFHFRTAIVQNRIQVIFQCQFDIGQIRTL